jgi:hypothetical protein
MGAFFLAFMLCGEIRDWRYPPFENNVISRNTPHPTHQLAAAPIFHGTTVHHSDLPRGLPNAPHQETLISCFHFHADC